MSEQLERLFLKIRTLDYDDDLPFEIDNWDKAEKEDAEKDAKLARLCAAADQARKALQRWVSLSRKTDDDDWIIANLMDLADDVNNNAPKLLAALDGALGAEEEKHG